MGAGVSLFRLAMRQLTERRRFLAVLLIALVPVGLSALYAVLADPTARDRADFRDGMLVGLVISLVLPMSTLLLATASFGDEVSERTLIYQALKPIARRTIVLPKLAAGIAIAAVVVGGSAALSTALATGGDLGEALAAGIALAFGAAAYVAIFTWAGLVTRHALAFGLIYVFLWESSLSSLFTGIRYLSVRQFTLATTEGLGDELLRTSDAVRLSLGDGIVGSLVVIAAFAALGTWSLRRMDVP